MAIALLVGRDAEDKSRYDWFIRDWQQALLKADPNLDIQVYPDIADKKAIDFALVWNHPLGKLTEFPNLKGIASLAAGVDHIFLDKNLPGNIPVVRVVDDYMANDIVQYVTLAVLQHVKRLEHWREKQIQKKWSKFPPFNFADKTIGIMGLGFLGSKAAHILRDLGLNVIGWSNSRKDIQGIKSFAGKTEFLEFLSQSQILICMLPLTPDTNNILNAKTFSYLPKGAYIINVGRGHQLVEEDLLAALASGQVEGAFLDVFRDEPLPESHPFWMHPGIRVTPHIASVTNAFTAAPQVVDNYQRTLQGQPLLNEVSVEKGY